MNDVEKFMRLFRGRADCYGVGAGRWIKQPLQQWAYEEHLAGKGSGLGVAPLMTDGKVWFSAVDLDEPDFEAAEELSAFLSFDGHAWIERSRSGNAHVWCFFSEPIPSWIPRGIMKEAIAAVGKPSTEIFPKATKLLPGMLGSYINLPYHGSERPMLSFGDEYPLAEFLEHALADNYLCHPDAWKKHADWLLIADPDSVEASSTAEFGTQEKLHSCAEFIIANRDENPVREGHRNGVYFALSKMLLNYAGIDDIESFEWLKKVRDSADAQGVEHFSDRELKRVFSSAKRGEFTSTGCSDPLMAEYVDPNCPIAKSA